MSNKEQRFGYLVPEFPAQTHIFFWRELCELRALGAKPFLISTSKPDLADVKHDFVPEAIKDTFYLHPPSIRDILSVFIKPLSVFNALKYVFRLELGLKSRVRVACMTVHVMRLLKFCKDKQITHVHGHSCADVAHLLAMAGATKKITYSLTLHGGLSVYGDNHAHKMNMAKFVSSVTRPLQDEIVSNTNLPKDRVPVISMGVDIEKFHPSVKKTDNSKIRLITVARLATGKGHRYSLEALARLEQKGIDFSFTIVGGGYNHQALVELVDQLKLSDKVTFTGTLSEEGVMDCLSKSDVILLTSYGDFEAAPVCIMEAMAMGIPSVTSIIGGTKDMVDSGVNGYLVEQKNIDQIESALESYATDSKLLNDFGVAARKKAEDTFDSKLKAKQLLEMIDAK